MAIRKILDTDTLKSGFRSKYNETIDEIPISLTLDEAGVLQIVKNSNKKLEVDLSQLFLTETQINELIEDIQSLITSKPFSYNSSDLSSGSIILDHGLDTVVPDVTIFADGVREVEMNTRVEIIDNGNGENNSVRITHYNPTASSYQVKIKK